MWTSRFFSFAIAVMFGVNALAQISYDTENKTEDLSPLKISFSFLNFENVLTPITAGLSAEGCVKSKLFYNVQFRQGYVRNFLISKSNLLTTQKEIKGTFAEAGVDWAFSDKKKPGRIKVITSSSNDGSYIRENYFLANCDVRKLWALSAGAMVYSRVKYINSDTSAYIISGTEAIKATGEKYMHLNQNTFCIYAGLSHRKIKKALVKTDGHYYGRFYSTKFYAQALAGTTSAGTIIYNEKTYKIDNAKQIPFGYRLGWQWDQMGVVTGFEFGKMPGVYLETPGLKSGISKIFVNNPFINYLRLTFYFNIYGGDKKYHMKL